MKVRPEDGLERKQAIPFYTYDHEHPQLRWSLSDELLKTPGTWDRAKQPTLSSSGVRCTQAIVQGWPSTTWPFTDRGSWPFTD
jgi:hypothetical protein